MTLKDKQAKNEKKLSVSEWNAITQNLINLSVHYEKLDTQKTHSLVEKEKTTSELRKKP